MIIRVSVKPNSKEEKIERDSEGNYSVKLKEKAENNKANIRLINLLAKEFKTSVNNIKIKTPKSRKKIVEILNNND